MESKITINKFQICQYGLKWVKNAQYLIIFLLCWGFLVYEIFCAFEKYLEKDTGTADEYVLNTKTKFPALTICPSLPYKEEILHRNGILDRTKVQFHAQWTSNDSKISPKDFYESIVNDIHEIINQVNITIEGEFDGQHHIILKPNDKICKHNESLFKPKPYYYNGDCFGFEMPSCLANEGPLEVAFSLWQKTDIFIHHIDQFLSPNSRSRVSVDINNYNKIAVNHEVVQLLPDYGNCSVYESNNSFDECMYSKLYQLMMNKNGCTVPWLLNHSNICIDYNKRKLAFELYQENRRNQQKICESSCLFSNMYFGPPVSGINDEDKINLAWAVFYFRRDIKVTHAYPLKTILSVMAEIGGYVGLLIGASAIKLADFNGYLLDLCFGKCKKSEVLNEYPTKSSTTITVQTQDPKNG